MWIYMTKCKLVDSASEVNLIDNDHEIKSQVFSEKIFTELKKAMSKFIGGRYESKTILS